MNISDFVSSIFAMKLSDPVWAAMIGATATVLATLVQLRLSWRKELKERERGQPITKKSRRGPVLFIFALVIAAAVGGFALSQYLLSWRNGDRDALRADLQSKLTEISASAARLEQARLNEREQIEAGARQAEALHLGEEGAAASAAVGPCKPECTEQNAVHVALCARVPAAAAVKEVLLYTRLEGAQQAWADSRVQPGQDAGQARFQEKFFERPDAEAGRQICQEFVNWNGEKSRLARIVVKYTLQAGAGPNPAAANAAPKPAPAGAR